MSASGKPQPRSVLDLPSIAIERVEDECGPMETWKDGPKAKLFRLLAAELDGVDPSEYEQLSVRELAQRFTFDDDSEGKDSAGASGPS